MKKLLLSLIVLISTLQISLARNEADTIKHEVKFSFSNPLAIKYPKQIKSGDFYKVVVEGINLNNYIVQLQNSDTVYSAKALDFPVFGSVDISDLDFSSFDITTFYKKVEESANKNKATEIRNYNSDISRINQQITASKDTLDNFKNELTKINKEIDKLYFDFAKVRILAKAQPMIESDVKLSIDDKLKAFIKLKDELGKLEVKFGKNLKGFNDFFVDPDVTIIIEKPENLGLKQQKEEVTSSYADKKKNLNELQSSVSTANVEKAIVSVYQLYQTTTYTSLPIQFNGEEAELRMKFIPKDSASNLQSYTLSPIKFGRSPWYWAVGPSLYYSKLQEERVGLETIQVNDSIQNFKALPESALKGELGVAALFHFGRKLNLPKGVDMGIHFSVGTGVSLSDEIRPRLLYGGGFSVGERHHLTVDLGWATGYVNRVSTRITGDPNGYDTIYPVKPDVLVTSLETKFFIGVGYMFRL
jgi:hypothetical protein